MAFRRQSTSPVSHLLSSCLKATRAMLEALNAGGQSLGLGNEKLGRILESTPQGHTRPAPCNPH